MRLKRITACILSTAMIFTTVSAFADIIKGPVSTGKLPEGYIMTASMDNIFRMKDDPEKQFILLDANPDKDSSTYYVMTYDGYGYHKFGEDKRQRFDPENPKNIAHWLNNDFKANGNNKGPVKDGVYKLPESIIKGIDFAHEWLTESGTPNSDCPDTDGKGYYTETAGIGLLSYSEAIEYNGIYGCIDNFRLGSSDIAGSNDGWFLRTSKPDEMIAIRPNFRPGEFLGWSTDAELCIRPTFYLTSDFLTKNGAVLDAKYIGKNVKKAFTANSTREELAAAGYSDSEIACLFDVDNTSRETVEVSLNCGIDENAYATINIEGIPNISYTAKYGITGGKTLTANLKNNAANKLEYDMAPDTVNEVFVEVYSDGDLLTKKTEKLTSIDSYKNQPLDELRNRGFSTHFGQGTNGDNEIKLLKAAGVKLVRDEVYWNHVEKEKGVYKFDSKLTNWVDKLYSNGIESALVLAYGNPLYFEGRAPKTAEDRVAYANYCRAVAERFKNVKVFEIWNEPNVGGFWNGKPNADEYSSMLKTASEAIREVRPDAKIIGGVTSDYRTAESFIKKVLENDVYAYIDGISIHPYYFYKDQDQRYYRGRLGVNQGIIDNEGGFKDLLVTEIGWSTLISDKIWNSDTAYTDMNGKPYFDKDGNVCFTVTDEEQAAKLVEAQVIADEYGLSYYTSYDFLDDGSNPYEFEHNLGVVDNKGNVKNAYISTKTLNEFVGGALYYGKILTDNPDSQIHVYNKNGEPVVVAWNEKSTSTISFENAYVTDMYGNGLGQMSEISLSAKPVYITGISDDILYKAAASHTLRYLNKAIENIEKNNLTNVLYEVNMVKTAMEKIAAGSLPNDTVAKNYVEQIFNAGDELQKVHNAGKSGMTVSQVSKCISYLYNAAKSASDIYASAVKPSDVVINTLVSSKEIEQSKEAVNLLDPADESKVYAEAIIRKAADENEFMNAVKAEDGVKIKNGLVLASDLVSARTAVWARKLKFTNSVKASVDGAGNMIIQGTTNKANELLTLLVLPPDVDYQNDPLLNMSQVDYIAELRSDKQAEFKVQYKTEGKYGKYTIVVLARSWDKPKTCEVVYVGDDVITKIIEDIDSAKSSEEIAGIFDNNLSVLEAQVPFFKKALDSGIDTKYLAQITEKNKDGIKNESTLIEVLEKVSAIAALNKASSTDEFRKVLTEYKRGIGFEALPSYATYKSSVLTQSDRDFIISSYLDEDYYTIQDWHDKFEKVIILTAISNSVYTNVMSVIETNNGHLNIDLKKYNKLSENKKYSVLKKFAGKSYRDYEDARKAFANAVKDIENSGAGGNGGGGGGSFGGSGGGGTGVEYTKDSEKQEEIFTDLNRVPWAEKSILKLYELGVVNGKGNKQFAPDDTVKREEFLKMLLSLFEVKADGENVFEDVDPDAWYYQYVISGYSMGIIKGESETRFGIGNNITREQMAAMAYRLLKSLKYELPADATVSFSDSADISSYALKPVAVLAELKILNGVGDNRFVPGNNATRAEAAVVICKLYEKFRQNQK